MNSRLQFPAMQVSTSDGILLERAGCVSPFNCVDTQTSYTDACVHELIEQQAARTPSAVAVVCGERQLSYRELNQRANQVAHYLRRCAVGPESLVGVGLERSPELVIGLLGVLKSGGAYVPLDPGYPRDRLSFMVGDTGMKILLTDEKCKPLFSSVGPIAVCLDSDWPKIARESTCNLSAGALTSNLAYVMYTSGSTGQPKGTMIEHRGLVNYLCWAIKAYEVDGRDSIPVHSSIAFDSTVASLYPPLLTGGQIEILPEDVGAQNLLAALRRMKNRSKVVLTPAHLEILNQQLDPQEMAGMTKVLVVAGETLSAEKLSKWRDFAPATRLFNEYGPTETSVGCSAYEVRAEDPRSGAVPIGRAISNTQLYVLDADMHPVLPGVSGDLYVGGAGVGRGYLNKPELTKERFIADPFSSRKGARLYKTGDLARYREDGTLEFLGRVDDQIKIRGYRIELGEIEATLSCHPDIQSCAVFAREAAPGNKQLVAYFVPRNRESANAAKLRNFLKQRLPGYMVPAYFVVLDSFPLTQNGKIDRKALPVPLYQDGHSAAEFAAPHTETEKKLAVIWMEMLSVDRLGIHDDFFDLGGTSLLAIQVALRIREVFGVALSMDSFCPSATIASLAHALEDREATPPKLVYVVDVQQNGEGFPFFWIGAGKGAGALSDQLGPDQPFVRIGFEPQMAEQLESPYRMEEIARHLVSALREKQPAGPYRLGGFCLGAVTAYEVATQLTALGEDVALLVLFEPMNPLQSVKVRFATGLRRMIIRINFRLGELRRLGLSQFPNYARNRWEGIKSLMTDMIWRVSARAHLPRRQFRSPDIEKVLFFAACSYEPKPLASPAVIFRCRDWPMLSAGDPYFGWRDVLVGPSETHQIPGDHAGIFREPNIRVLAGKLSACLRKAMQTEKPA